MRRFAFCVAFVVLALSAPACSDSLGVEDILGIWEVISLNGDPVPGEVTIITGDSQDDINFDYIRVNVQSGNVCVLSWSVEGFGDSMDGTYVLNIEANTLTTTFDEVTLVGSISGDSMTATDDDGNVYRLRLT